MKNLHIQSRRYLGNKLKLISSINKLVKDKCGNFSSFVDLFSGTGVVADNFNESKVQIITNDILYSNYVISKCFFGSYQKGKYNYSAESIGDLRVCVFKQSSLDDYLEKNMKLAKELLHMTSHELTLAQDRMMVLGKMNASERVVKFILNISNQRLRIGWQNNPISIPMTRQDIADYLGLTLETISREFTKLKTANVIKFLSSKQIYITDKDKLSSACN